jgi:hypothetical protein
MTHRLYDETCLERWQRIKKREEAEAVIKQIYNEEKLRHKKRREEHEESSRRPNKPRPHRPEDATTPRSRDDDPIIGMPNVVPNWDQPSSTIDPSPSTIDPGGGSSGGGGATGDY